MIILSIDPAEALGLLAGFDTHLTAVMDRGVQALLQRKPHYRVAVHTLGFPDDADQKNLCHEVLAEFGFDCHTFPALAIQGLVTVQWLGGQALHCYHPFFLSEPIYDILPPCLLEAEPCNRLWLAQHKDHFMALQWAFQNDGRLDR